MMAAASLSPGHLVIAILIGALQWSASLCLIGGMVAGVAFLSRRLMRKRYDRATVSNITVDEAGTASIPVLATFTGVRGLPWWYGVAVNNAKPVLAIEGDGIRFRVVREQRRGFADIACADVRQAIGTVNLELTFHGSLLTFAANLGSGERMVEIVR